MAVKHKQIAVFLTGLFLWPVFLLAQTGPQRYLQDGIRFYQQGDFESAYQNFRLYEPLGQPDKTFYVYFAMSALKSGHDDAVAILKRGLNRFPDDSDLILVLVQVLSQKQQFRQAIEYLQKAKASMVPQEYKRLLAGLNFNVGVQLYQKNKVHESLPYFKKAVQLQPDDARFVRNLAIVLWKTDQKKKAIDLLEKAVTRFPEDTETNRLLILFYQKSGNLKKLQTRLEETAHKSGKLKDYLALQQFYLLSGNQRKARDLFLQLKKRFPKEKEIYLTPVRYYRRVFQYEQADSLLRQMQTQFPNDTLVCVLKARNYEDMDSLKLAAQAWQECLQRFPYKSNWHFALLNDLRQTDSTAYFAHLQEMAERLTDSETRFRLALEWMKNRRYQEALPLLRQLARFDSSSGLYLTYLGLCYERLGRDTLAVQTYRKAIELADAGPQAYFGLARYSQDNPKKSALYFTLGLERLLSKLREGQSHILNLAQKAQGLKESPKLKKIVAAYEDYDRLLKRELGWYQKTHRPEQTERFLEDLLERFPKNAYLRLMLAELMADQGNFARAEKYIDDALFMKPDWPQAWRLKIRIARTRGQKQAVLRGYLTLLYRHPDQFRAADYRALLEIARGSGQIKTVAQQLDILHARFPDNALLKQFAVEAWHLAGNHARARQIATEKSVAPKQKKELSIPLIKTQ